MTELRSTDLAIKHMDTIMEWLRANDIEPTDVPVWHVPKISDGQITCRVYLRRDGRKYLVDGEPAMDTVVVPLKEAPPEVLSQWLASVEQR